MTAPALQTEPYFSLHRRFVDRHAMRRLRAAGVPYGIAATWRAVMFDLATNSGTFGEFSTDVRAFVEACGGDPKPEQDEQHVQWWRMFAHVGLVELDGDPGAIDEVLGLPAEFRVHVPDVGDVNEKRKAPDPGKVRTRRWREKQKAGTGDAVTSPVTPPESASVTPRDAANVTSSRDARNTANSRESDETVTPRDAGVTCDAEPPIPTNQPPTQSLKARGAEGEVEDGGAEVVNLPTARMSSYRAQRNRARGELGSIVFAVEGLLADAQADRDELFTDREQVQLFYHPAIELLAEFGRDRLASALAEARKRSASSMKYVATVCRSQQRADHQRQTSNPDHASGDWADLIGETVDTTTEVQPDAVL